MSRAVSAFAQAHALSFREAEVVRLGARGLATKTIASELGIGYKTVSQYWTRACQKVGCGGPAELLAALLRHALTRCSGG
ncbi:helix-turn-helix domain-containing protein [Corallococcus terminator]